MKILAFKFAVICISFLTSHIWASGAYSPSGGRPSSESYNLGKAIVTGQIPISIQCKDCHKNYSRGALRKLDLDVGALITACEKHKPCFKDELDDKKTEAVSIYFNKRYRLRRDK